MRRLLHVLPVLILASCQDDTSDVINSDDGPALSYSRDVRPFLVENCVGCHADLPLRDPNSWNLLHQHKDKTVPASPLLQRWVKQGAVVDAHWATAPLYEVTGESVNDFLTFTEEGQPELRETPEPLFKARLKEVLTGEGTLPTTYLRGGADTPATRVALVGQHLLGTRMECASCHNHPTEEITKAKYRELQAAFTMPEDHQRGSGRGPSLIVISKEEEGRRNDLLARIAKFSGPPRPDHKAFLDWLDEGGLPEFHTMLAAYSFEEELLTNLALQGKAREGGRELIADEGAHGKGLLFAKESQLTIGGLPVENEFSAFTLSAWIKLTPEAHAETRIAVFGAAESGFAFEVIGGRLRARWTRSWPDSALAVGTPSPMIVPNRWAQVAISWDGSRMVEGLKIYLNGTLLETQVEAQHLLMPTLADDTTPQFIFEGEGLSLDELQIFRGVLPPVAVSHLFDGRSLVDARENGGDLRAFFHGQRAKENPERAKVAAELLNLEANLTQYPVMTGGAKREAFADSLNANLLARSLANEIWRNHFGAPLAYGLGYGDPLPKHAELLEWLANELVRLDWDQEQLGEIIRESKAWTRKWDAEPDLRRPCPRPR